MIGASSSGMSQNSKRMHFPHGAQTIFAPSLVSTDHAKLSKLMRERVSMANGHRLGDLARLRRIYWPATGAQLPSHRCGSSVGAVADNHLGLRLGPSPLNHRVLLAGLSLHFIPRDRCRLATAARVVIRPRQGLT